LVLKIKPLHNNNLLQCNKNNYNNNNNLLLVLKIIIGSKMQSHSKSKKLKILFKKIINNLMILKDWRLTIKIIYYNNNKNFQINKN